MTIREANEMAVLLFGRGSYAATVRSGRHTRREVRVGYGEVFTLTGTPSWTDAFRRVQRLAAADARATGGTESCGA
jgi:hypothetical protein